ncbi:MAG: NAD(P)H-hydrate dehydratase [Ignavibacteriales bacterium]|nr:NAD(P)H-hydrate dehydratase [Ignavibacteriales bacterium]
MIPLFSVSQVKAADSFAINQLGIPSVILMENASTSIFNIVKEKYYPDKFLPIGFVCGKGNNGGDGFAVARHFFNEGYKVKVIYLADENELTGDSLTNFLILKNLITKNSGSTLNKFKSIKQIKTLKDCQFIFDALLGTGSNGKLRFPFLEIINEINKFNSVRIAIDIPTGLEADTGFGEDIINADLTVSLAELKRGLFIGNGATSSGEVKKGYIGIPQTYFDKIKTLDFLIEPEDVVGCLPTKRKDIHKYSAGKVVVLAGSAKVPSAAFLAANAVFKVGSGAAYLCFPLSLRTLAQRKVTEVIVEAYSDARTGIYRKENINELKRRFEWADVIAIGPGMGRDDETITAILETIRKYKSKRIVLDADAIYALSKDKYKNYDLKNFILTPHHGEFSSLVGISNQELQQNILEIGRSFAKEKECYLVLKDAPTIIFNPTGEALINTTGNVGMAKFGTGDVLTGVIAGFLSQSKNIEDAIVAGVYIHSLSADLLLKEKTEFGITATAISENLPTTISFLRRAIV